MGFGRENIFEDFTEAERNKFFGKAPATVYENLTQLDSNPSKLTCLKRNGVFTDAIINSFKLATIERWTTEITHRVINNYIDEFNNKNINLSMNNYDKIKSFHDHIVNRTMYDEENKFDSYTAYNLITSGISICGGYSDIMAIYMNQLDIKNYKIIL